MTSKRDDLTQVVQSADEGVQFFVVGATLGLEAMDFRGPGQKLGWREGDTEGSGVDEPTKDDFGFRQLAFTS